jgi:hypothetical protein
MSAAKGAIMNTTKILAELRSECDRIERAIAAIVGLNSSGRRRGRPPGAVAKKRGRRRLSAAARRKLSRLLKQRWAQGKMKRAQASKPVRKMSRAARNRIAAAQRARWAKVRAQKKAA